MDGRTDGYGMDEWMDGWVDGWVNEQNEWMDARRQVVKQSKTCKTSLTQWHPKHGKELSIEYSYASSNVLSSVSQSMTYTLYLLEK